MFISLIMLSVVMLSLGATFASDDVSDVAAIDDEITIDEPLAVEQDAQAVSVDDAKVYITNSNINQYIDEAGKIYENVTADELVFVDTFDNLNLTVERPIILTGGDSSNFNNPNIEIYSSNVILQNFTIVQLKGMNSIFVGSTVENPTANVNVSHVNITFTDDQSGADAIPIQVINCDNFVLEDSSIFYTGRTNGYYINNAIRITNSRNALISNNKITASLVSAPVGWTENPAGSGIWVSSPMSEGIVIEDSEGAIFDSNFVKVTFNNVTGSYDTIYAVDIDGSDNAIISNNDIVASGYTYIYGIILSGDNFQIRANNISSTGVYYANGIDIEGPATGEVAINDIEVAADVSAYGIYSGMNGADVKANYTANTINGIAYNVFGFSLGDVESNLEGNEIYLEGNYSTGIAYYGSYINAYGNQLYLYSSEVGNESIWEEFGVEAVGIKVTKGYAILENNDIFTTGKGISLAGNETTALVTDNSINAGSISDKDAYAIYAIDVPELTFLRNHVDYAGTTKGTGINNALYLNNVSFARIALNKFDLELVSSYVPWFEIPAGSGIWVSFPVSEGIVVESSNDVIFTDNDVNVTYGDVVGSYDTIYAVVFKDSDNAYIMGNNITANGHTYIYGIQISGDNFIIGENNISVASDIYYANGIDIEGPATGEVIENIIDVDGVVSAYAIYSGMNGADVKANYTDNIISAGAYNVFGFSLGDVESNLENNTIILGGNYTTGIAYYGSYIKASENYIKLYSSEEGNESIWEEFGVETVGIKVAKGFAVLDDNTIVAPGKGISLTGNETTANVNDNYIYVKGNEDKDAYAIYAIDVPELNVLRNIVDYIGSTAGTGINNALYLNNVSFARISLNKFDLDLVSSYVPWAEIPAGSGKWVSFPVSEGIVVESSYNPIFADNDVNVDYSDVVGSYDTIYAVVFKDSDNANIVGNNITANGHTYIYGIQISGNNFNILDNNISVASDNYYANGIDIEGPATGEVTENIIDVDGVVSAYAIYSGMNGADVKANYTDNIISAGAYNVFGFSLGDVESNLENNTIDLGGNYTTGIAYYGSYIKASENYIRLYSSEEGNESIWEEFGVETVGIKVAKGYAYLEDNTIVGQGKGISLTGNETTANVNDNYIYVSGNEDKDAYAIYAIDVPELNVLRNQVYYEGSTKGTGINNALYLNNVSARISFNKFDLDLVSSFVPWFEIPAGSGKWVSFPVSEGIVVDSSDDVIFTENDINVTYSDVVGSYDTIYAVVFKDSDNAMITDNNITANGHTYIYGIQISGDNFLIADNNITVVSDNYYANGIDIEGPATGKVEYNDIDVEGVVSAYAIYSGMNGANVSANYTDNTIAGSAYNVFGFSLGDVESNLEDNKIYLEGNYSTGIAYYGILLEASGNELYLYSSEVGNESIWESFGVEAVGIKVAKGYAYLEDNTIFTSGKGISLAGNETTANVNDNSINVGGIKDKDAYAIYAIDVPELNVLRNHIDYAGTTEGNGINNAIYISNVSFTRIAANKFDLELVSSYVPWFEIPAGSGIWVSFPVSEGIVVDSSDDVIFTDNDVNVTYSDVVGSYDTIYAVVFKDSDNANIVGNNITAKGHTYIYGIQISGDNFNILDNIIDVASDNYYANGIDIEGPATGEVIENIIDVEGVVSAYAIYSGMNGANVSANYTDNVISGSAYNVFGFSLGDVESNIVNNYVALDGNYTTGIAFRGSKLTVDDNRIDVEGSNVGNESIWEAFGVENIGVKVVAGDATITNNVIYAPTAEYTVDVKDTNSSVHDNILMANELLGDASVNKSGDAKVYDNHPRSVSGTIEITEVDGDCTVIGVLKDGKGNPIGNQTLIYLVNGVDSTVVTDENGIFKITNNTNGKLEIFYQGEEVLNPVNTSIILKDITPPRLGSEFNVTEGISIKTYAVDSKAGEVGQTTSFKLTDSNGNPIVNATVKFAYKTVILNRTTDENGIVFIGINTQVAQEALCAMSYLGDEKYNATFVAFSFDIQKKPITLSASSKTYKASAKSKKYTVTIKTEKCNSNDGKVYLSAGKKITMKINGKTYTAKTNSKGQATFNIKITKKGKYSATVKFAGDKTYDSASKKVKITIK